MTIRRFFIATWLVMTAVTVAQEPPEPAKLDLRLTLPATAFAVVGAPIGVDFDNIVLTPTPEDYRFVVDCAIGETTAGRWTVTPKETDVGDHPWRVTVWKGDEKVDEQSMTWRINPPTAGSRTDVSLLLVGDSLTHATVYPNDLARRLSAPGQPKWTMLGTHRPASAAMGVAHEGYGG